MTEPARTPSNSALISRRKKRISDESNEWLKQRWKSRKIQADAHGSVAGLFCKRTFPSSDCQGSLVLPAFVLHWVFNFAQTRIR